MSNMSGSQAQSRIVLLVSFFPLLWSLLVLALWPIAEALETDSAIDLSSLINGLEALLFIPVILSWFYFLRRIVRHDELSNSGKGLWLLGMFFLPYFVMPLFAVFHERPGVRAGVG
ncbi:MAG: hypothetical protein WBI27_02290 [Thermoanaerobaculia bacterium]